MPNFTIFGNDATAKTLSSGEEGVIASNGNLVVQSGIAITATDSTNIAVLGTVGAVNASGIRLNGVSNGSITVGTSATVFSLSSDAVQAIKSSGFANVINNGEITSTASDGVELTVTGGFASVQKGFD